MFVDFLCGGTKSGSSSDESTLSALVILKSKWLQIAIQDTMILYSFGTDKVFVTLTTILAAYDVAYFDADTIFLDADNFFMCALGTDWCR